MNVFFKRSQFYFEQYVQSQLDRQSVHTELVTLVPVGECYFDSTLKKETAIVYFIYSVNYLGSSEIAGTA